MKYITLARLKQLHACPEQRRLFKKLFGSRVAVTEEKLLPHASKFEAWWAAERFLSVGAFRKYRAAAKSALKSYERVAKAPMDDYSNSNYSAAAFAKYNGFIVPACEKFERAKMAAFIRLYNQE